MYMSHALTCPDMQPHKFVHLHAHTFCMCVRMCMYICSHFGVSHLGSSQLGSHSLRPVVATSLCRPHVFLGGLSCCEPVDGVENCQLQ